MPELSAKLLAERLLAALRVRLVLTVGAILLMAQGGIADPVLDRFEKALDAFEYERALQIASEMPAGPERTLLSAEQAVARGRADRSFGFTDVLKVGEIPPTLLAKYFLVRAYQEQATAYDLDTEKQRAVHQMLNTGLRQHACSARDRAKLLLHKVETAADISVAKESSAELAEIGEVDSRFAFMAEAIIEEKQGQFARAAMLWKALADNAKLAGETRAEWLFGVRQALVLHSAKRSPQGFAIAEPIFRQSLDAGDTVVAFQSCMACRLTVADPVEGALFLREAYQRMPGSIEKLQLIMRLLANWDESLHEQLARTGQALAKELGEPLLEGYFWLRLARVTDAQAEAEGFWEKGQALMAGCDVRGMAGNIWYGHVPQWRGRKLESASRREISISEMEKDLATSHEVMHRTALYANWVTAALMKPRSEVAKTAVLNFFEEIEKVPAGERFRALDDILSSIDPFPFSTEAPGDQLEFLRAGSLAVGRLLQERPDLVKKILDANLIRLNKTVDRAVDRRKQLARWLAILGRPDEALEVYRSIVRRGPNDHTWISNGPLRVLLREGKLEALDTATHQIGTFSPDLTGDWFLATSLGWAALEHDRVSMAHEWARQAFKAQPKDRLQDFLEAKPYALLAISLSHLGRLEESLQVLADGEALDQETAKLDLRYRLPRARVLLEAGRLDECEQALAGVVRSTVPGEAYYQHKIRRDLAGARGQAEERARFQALMLAHFQDVVSDMSDPTFAHFYTAAVADDLGLPVPPLPELPSSTTFAEVAEDLERLRRREPKNEALRHIAAAELKGLMELAEEDELFLQPLLLKDSVATFCVARDRIELVEVICDRQEIDRAMVGLASGLSTPGSNLELLAPTRAYLSRWLVQPWQERFPAKRRVRWIGGEGLQRVPLSSLYDAEGKELLERVEISFLDGPQRHTLHLGLKTPALLVGGSEDLPGATKELAIVGNLFAQNSSWKLGEPLSRLATLASGSGLVHIATHGMSPSSRRLGGTLRGEKGEVSAFALSQLSFPAGTLAVVGACESAVDGESGHDNSSLVSALRTAGADVVVGSQWELEDQVTSQLFATFYEALLAGAAPEAALSKAQRAIRTKYPHPYYWAGLQAVSGP